MTAAVVVLCVLAVLQLIVNFHIYRTMAAWKQEMFRFSATELTSRPYLEDTEGNVIGHR